MRAYACVRACACERACVRVLGLCCLGMCVAGVLNNKVKRSTLWVWARAQGHCHLYGSGGGGGAGGGLTWADGRRLPAFDQAAPHDDDGESSVANVLGRARKGHADTAPVDAL